MNKSITYKHLIIFIITVAMVWGLYMFGSSILVAQYNYGYVQGKEDQCNAILINWEWKCQNTQPTYYIFKVLP